MPETILATLLYFVFLIVLVLRTLYTMHLWQFKEYRGDKMMEWLTHKVGRNAVFNKWFNIRAAISVILAITWLIQGSVIIGWLAGLSWGIEAVLLSRKFIRGTLSKPVFTSKLKIASVLVVINLFFWLSFWQGLNSVQLQLWLHIVYLLLPVITGYCFLLLFPIDWLVKEKLFKKARAHRASLSDLKVIAISGSYGKTTIKEFLDFVIKDSFNVAKTIKNQNSNVSCARKLLTLDSNTQIFLCELGAYKRGDGAEICSFISPDMAIVSGMNNQHFGLFGNERNIILAESEALAFLPDGAPGVINYSSSYNRKINIPDNIKKYRFTTADQPIDGVELVATNITSTVEGSEFTIIYNGKSIPAKTNQISIGNIENILAVIAISLELGLTFEDILPKLENLPQVEGRLELTQTDHGIRLYNAYNNINGLENIFRLASLDTRKVCIIQDDINELGKEALKTHELLAKYIIDLNPELIVLIGNSYASLISDACIKGGIDSSKILIKASKQEVSKYLYSHKTERDWLVLNLGLQSKYYLDV